MFSNKIFYHWTPSKNRESIHGNGLKITGVSNLTNVQGYFSYICLGISPSNAWSLLPVDLLETKHEKWDLWEVEISENDRVKIREDQIPNIREIRVKNTIPPDRVWFVGKREVGDLVNIGL